MTIAMLLRNTINGCRRTAAQAAASKDQQVQSAADTSSA
jgi:hypothetical protein